MKSRFPVPCLVGGAALLTLGGAQTTTAKVHMAGPAMVHVTTGLEMRLGAPRHDVRQQRPAAASRGEERPAPPPLVTPSAAPRASASTLQPLTTMGLAARPASPYEPSARPAQEASAQSEAASRVRYQVQNMESMLVNAVQHAADRLTRQIRAVSPDIVMLTGAPRARGVMLEGYGAFFSVDVPAMSPSINWSLRVLAQKYLGVESALTRLRRSMTALEDPKARADAELALQAIEIQVRPQRPRPVSQTLWQDEESPQRTTAASASPVPAPDAAGELSRASVEATSTSPSADGVNVDVPDELLRNPSEAYEREVKRTLVDTMLDYAGPIPVAPNEWFTVAARDADYTIAPGGGQAVTIILQLSGADLEAYRAGRLSHEEVRRRVKIQEF
ncbi:MAG: hypothetical protein GEV06_14445 [Luteitalea sp.]|nr:hypothetical protein [Luteitalea sp.]